MATVDFDAFDADNHYYEATDAFTRHLPAQSLEARAVGRDRRQAADDRRQQDLPLHPEPHVRSGRAARLPRRLLPRQGRRRRHPRRVRRARADQPRVPRPRRARRADGHAAARRAASCSRRSASAWKRRCCTTPTRCTTVFHAFNEWMHDDWTFNYHERIFAAPVHRAAGSRAQAEAEVEYALEQRRARRRDAFRPGARPVVLALARATRSTTACGRASPRPASSPRTTRATRATAVTPTSGAAAATSRRSATTRSATSPAVTARSTTPIAALVCHGVFRRHPNLRVATIESGSDWVPLLLHALKKSYGQAPRAYEGVDPVEQVRDHVWVSPYYEDDLPELRDELGADQHDLRLRLPARRGSRRPAVVRRTTSRLHRRRDPARHARERAWRCRCPRV